MTSEEKSSKPKRSRKDHPQAIVSRFWDRFHHKTPGKVTSIFPRELYKTIDPDFVPASARVRNAAQSYEDARTKCLELVRTAVADCESTNSKFCDPEFDLEQDFFFELDDCLYGLERCNCAEESSDDDEDEHHHPKHGEQSARPSKSSRSSKSKKPPHKCSRNKPANRQGVLACTAKTRPQAVHRIPWIFDNPQFTVDGFSGSDIKQGAIGDCWWLVGVGNIAHRKDLMNKICVARDEECGVYGFVFFKDGEWVPTIIDDNLYLHTEDYGASDEIYDSSGKKTRLWKKRYQSGSEALFCAQCESENETWLPLLEKAYAKIHGDFEAIEGGWSGSAVEDLTGGVTSMILSNRVLRKEKLWRELVEVDGENGEFVFGLSASGPSNVDKKNGLQLNHAYAITRAVEVEDSKGVKTKLLKIRNPWGQNAEAGLGEWHGPWSDGSKEWTHDMITRLEHEFGDDGVFWMTLEDTLSNFKWLHRTRLFDERWTVAQHWTSTPVSWIPGYLQTKFLVEVEKEGTAVIVLSQLDERYYQALEGPYAFSMEFLIRSVDSPAILGQARCSNHDPANRAINCEVYLKPGKYEVLPKVHAERYPGRPPVEDVIKKYAIQNPRKLQQLGMQHDIAHAKVGVLDEDEVHIRKQLEKKREKREQKRKEEAENDMAQAMEKMQLAMAEMQLELNKHERNKMIQDMAEIKEKLDKRIKKEGKNSKDDDEEEEEAKATPANKGASAAPGAGKNKRRNRRRNRKAKADEEEKKEEEEKEKEENDDEEEDEDDEDDSDYEDSEEEDSDEDDDDDDEEEEEEEDDDDSDEDKLPWNPVCVMCLSVYAQDKGVTVKVLGEDEEDSDEEEEEEEEEEEKE
ncbi:unnamed protein product [Clonostachys solani]|uniref:Calpain catalytic domain-containing protein n=1 Tax=Clonostachys solani TaxID=160281 RepID=A0A9P0ES44_9HYPO|nr:unnamed protein product [Clonostachys solani]